MRAGGVVDQRLYYDGKTMTLFNPAEKVYATEAAPPTVEKMIDFARESDRHPAAGGRPAGTATPSRCWCMT